MAGKKNEDDYKDQVDKLPPNAYSDPLMKDTHDDPKATTYGEKELPIRTQIIEKTVEVEKKVPTEVIKEVIKPVTVEVEKEVPIEVLKVESTVNEVKIIQEVPVETVVYKDVEVPVEIPVQVLKEVPIEVPVEIIKEVVKEVPVEVIKEEFQAEEFTHV